MPPKNNNQPSNDPNSYGFILNNKAAKKSPGFPKLNLPRPVKIFGLICALFLILILAIGLRGSGGGDSSLLDIAARQQEILRVSDAASSDAKDRQTQNLIASVVAVFTSEQQQTAKYLGIKTTSASLAKYRDASTDTQLKTAAQNNAFDATYLTYLKQSLLAYQRTLQSEALVAPSNAQPILDSAKNDVASLLSSGLLSGSSTN